VYPKVFFFFFYYHSTTRFIYSTSPLPLSISISPFHPIGISNGSATSRLHFVRPFTARAFAFALPLDITTYGSPFLKCSCARHPLIHFNQIPTTPLHTHHTPPTTTSSLSSSISPLLSILYSISTSPTSQWPLPSSLPLPVPTKSPSMATRLPPTRLPQLPQITRPLPHG
jgi:hypothetical protein